MGKENNSGHKPGSSRHSKSLRMEKGLHHLNEATPPRSQSVGAAGASRIKPGAGHQSPADLERKHSQLVRRPSGIFGGKPALKTPRIDQTTSLFGRLQAALSEYRRHLEEALNTVESKRKRIVEQRIKLIDSRIQQIDEIFQLYQYNQKMREGSRNLLNALTSRGSKGGQDTCRVSINTCTEKMCAIEEELESKLGIFRFKLNALLAFGRLCSGDVYDVHIKHGTSFKWKSRCKVEREGQKWTDNEFTLKPAIADGFAIRVIEMKKIQSNVQIGNILLRSRNYIKVRPQIVSVPLNSTGSIKLKITVEWRPFSGKEEDTLRSKRPSLLSEVIFLQPAAVTRSEKSAAKSTDGDSEKAGKSSSAESHSSNEPHVPVSEVAEDMNDSADVAHASLSSVISEEPQEFRHATSLDNALQHLIPTLQSHKDQFPELDDFIVLLEKLEELLKKSSLSRSSMSLSVESALESFDFLEHDGADENESTPRSMASGNSECHDTGYNSNDDFTRDAFGESAANASYIVDFLTDEKTVEDLAVTNSDDRLTKNSVSNGQYEWENEDNADIDSSHDAPSCISDIFSSSSSSPLNLGEETTVLNRVESKEKATHALPSNNSSPRKRIEIADMISEQSPQHSSKTRSSRATSPNLSSSYGTEATVGNKVLDKVILCHLQFCEEVSAHLGSFGPMKFKEMTALVKFRRQRETLEKLLSFVVQVEQVNDLTLPQINPRLASNQLLCTFWEKTCKGQSSLMFTTAGQLVSALEDSFKKQIVQSYNRVVDVVFPLIVARVSNQNPDLNDVQPEEEDIITIFQFEHYFMDYCRPNLSKYINDVAYELVITKRLLSPEKDAVVAQLKQYTEIPLTKTCFCPLLCLLLDSDYFVVQAAEAYLLHLKKNGELRKKAITLSTESLEESEEKLREGACVALTVLQGRDAVPQLLYLSRCDVQSVKLAARRALSSLGEEGEDALRKSTLSSSEIAGLTF